ncbi:MAG: hybrid sensor histidine kinase/response regulator, partial [Nevskia sp.]|nr:hybrid sensor histidine kinase/response regulator [Nevskia sp.]
MDIETEAQIAARGLGAGSSEVERAADQYGPDFDPLEMDRFSRMQELSRALAESVNDLAALQTTMDEAVRETETLLLQQSRINSEVQQGLMGTLMVPFSRQVQRLLRVVRQTAQENGKQADIRFSGAEAELDRNVLERITAPLEHLLRNAVVHGIEEPALRALVNKPLVGAIDVKLHREGGQLLVEVSDDGAGLDLPAIRAKAIERGLLAPQAQLSDGDLARFIFEPGFSTAKTLTQDAGRGIGMDVVASEVKQLGGTLELRSEAGSGARFLLRLPLTLAVSQALMVGVGHETYALPLPSVEGIARIPRGDFDNLSRADGPLYAYGGRGYRVRHLADYLELPRALNADARNLTAILVRLGDDLGSGERRVALVIDQLLGNRDIVTKAIGPQISSVPGVAGATLLADGRVVLILDVPALVAEHARRALLSDAFAAVPPTRDAAVLDTIMVVDDSVTMRRVAERLLLRNGYRVVTARDGLDAIAQLQTETPVTLLLDIEMPRADGFEVATFVRNNPRLRDVPIIMITSRSGEKHRERARVLGVDRYLIKPYQEDQLLAEVKSVRQAKPA